MKNRTRALPTWRQQFRDNRLLVVVDLLLVAAVFVADQHHLIFF
ncbi:MAG: hypothetical protein ACR2ID_11965 [Chthoniobacterales bacterium]